MTPRARNCHGAHGRPEPSARCEVALVRPEAGPLNSQMRGLSRLGTNRRRPGLRGAAPLGVYAANSAGDPGIAGRPSGARSAATHEIPACAGSKVLPMDDSDWRSSGLARVPQRREYGGVLGSVVGRLARTRRSLRRTRLNVVLPQAPGYNVGMAAVDLGLIAVAREFHLDITPWRVKALHDRAQLREPGIDRRMDVGLGEASLIQGSWPDGIDEPILYFGDFHHMAQYVNAVGAAIGGVSGVDLARRYLLLDGVDPAVVGRSATFGTTLIFNNAADFLEADYGRSLQSLLAQNAVSWFRDPISVAMASRLRGRDGVFLGVDPALFAGSTLASLSRGHHGVGLFLGRNRRSHAGLMRIASRLSQSLGQHLEWIDWGDHGGFPNLELPDGIAKPSEVGSTTALEALTHLASCAVVVTDSYHAALIAWRLGTPAVTVTAPAATTPRSVDSGARWSWRDKRELAGSLYGALDLVVRVEELEEEQMLDARIGHVVEVVGSGVLSRFVKCQMQADVAVAMSSLGSFISNAVGAG